MSTLTNAFRNAQIIGGKVLAFAGLAAGAAAADPSGGSLMFNLANKYADQAKIRKETAPSSKP